MQKTSFAVKKGASMKLQVTVLCNWQLKELISECGQERVMSSNSELHQRVKTYALTQLHFYIQS